MASRSWRCSSSSGTYELVIFHGTLVANRDIYGDIAALLVDLASSAALPRAWHLCAEALYLSPTKATIRTAVQQPQWQMSVEAL